MNKKYKFILFNLSFIWSFSTYAWDVQIAISAQIVGQSCNVNSADLTKNINFPDIDPRDFNSVGDYTEAQKFSINLKDCTGNVRNLNYKFSGDADDLNPNLFKIMGSNGANSDGIAKGLGIEVLDASKRIIPINTGVQLNENITAKTYDLNFYIRYKSTDLNVTAGDASSILYLDIYYD